MPDFDLVVRSGTVVDGTGGDPFVADVGIRDGRIAAIGRLRAGAVPTIDADGLLVTPGFVDVHTHYDGQVTWEHRLQPSSTHGVTTVVMGNCGVGFAPIRHSQRELAIRLMEGVEDIPEVVMTTGLPWNWETFPEYLDALDRRQADIDFATQLPHSPLRVYVMGERGANLEPPTTADLSEMRRLTCEAVTAGALGVSTSRSGTHRFRSGELAPSVPAQDAEVLALAEGLRDAGSGVFQMVPDYTLRPEVRFELLRNVARVSGRPVSFTFLQTPYHPGDWRDTLQWLQEARRDGLQIRGQVIPRPTGVLLGLDLSLNPFSLNPGYREIAEWPLAAKVERMRDPMFRRRLISESPVDPHPFFVYLVSELEAMYILGDPPDYNPRPEDSIFARARAVGIDPREMIYDALLLRDGREVLYRPTGNAEGERYESSGRNLLRHDTTIVALGDGGAHYGMICDAAYPTYLLTYWCRDADEARRLELPCAIRKLTAEPADAVGLGDRGRVRVGCKADLNLLDLSALRLHAPHVVHDLPAGGRRIVQRADGYVATIVSGEVTYRDGVETGALPGRLVRGARSTPPNA